MRMPAVYPFYLAYVDARGHPGMQLLSVLTAGRAEPRTQWPQLVGGTSEVLDQETQAPLGGSHPVRRGHRER